MRYIEKILIASYFFLCPMEMVLNILFTSTTKYIGLLLIIVWGIGIISNKSDAKLIITKHMIAIILWLVLCLLTLSWGIYSSKTNEYMITYIRMVVFVFICTQQLWSKEEIGLFLKMYCIGGVIVASTVILFGDTRVYDRASISIAGKTCDPNQLAANIIPGALISIYYLISYNWIIVIKLFQLMAVMLTVFAILLTGSRGGLTGLFIGTILLFITNINREDMHITYIIAIALIAIISTRFLPISIRERLLDFSTYTEVYANGGNRLSIWSSLLSDYKGNWILGNGVGSTVTYFSNIYGHGVGVHNTFLLILYEVGVIGLILFVYPYISLILYHIKNGFSIVPSILISSVICSFFLDALNLRYIWNSLILAMMLYELNEEIFINNNKLHIKHYRYIRDNAGV